MTKQWVYGGNPDLGFFDGLGRTLGEVEESFPNAYPNLRTDNRVLVVSDYSGDASSARFRAYALLITPFDGGQDWGELRRRVRRDFLKDDRSMAYKALASDHRRAKALLPFLAASNMLRGLLVVMLVDKGIESLFETDGLKINEIPELQPLSHWKRSVLEDALRVTNLACCFLSGLGSPGQQIRWLSDQDATVANPKRKSEFGVLLANVAESYPRVYPLQAGAVTIDQPIGSTLFEDLAAIPDLAAGGLVHLLDTWPEYIEALRLGLSIPVPSSLQEKTRIILRWLEDDTTNLKRVILIVDENPVSHLLNAIVLKLRTDKIDL